MRYTLLLRYPETTAEELGPERLAEGMRAFSSYAKALEEAGVLASAEVLQRSDLTTTAARQHVRHRGRRSRRRHRVGEASAVGVVGPCGDPPDRDPLRGRRLAGRPAGPVIAPAAGAVAELAAFCAEPDPDAIPDTRLELLFACGHRACAPATCRALTSTSPGRTRSVTRTSSSTTAMSRHRLSLGRSSAREAVLLTPEPWHPCHLGSLAGSPRPRSPWTGKDLLEERTRIGAGQRAATHSVEEPSRADFGDHAAGDQGTVAGRQGPGDGSGRQETPTGNQQLAEAARSSVRLRRARSAKSSAPSLHRV